MRLNEYQRVSEHLLALNEIGKSAITEAPDQYANKYNCWNFTATVMGHAEDYRWFMSDEMEAILDEHTIRVDTPQIGDIGVWDDQGRCLLHTATVVQVEPEVVLIHKPGLTPLACETLEELHRKHPCYRKLTEYRRQEREVT